MKRKLEIFLAVFIFAVCVSACGGSGGGDNSSLPQGTTVNTVTESGYGDVNGDKKVDITDARLLLQSLVGKYTISDDRMEYAKVSGGEEVGITDARLLLQKIVGKIDVFPAEEK
ncbi:MAG: dockerin type I repeat-containing protein [Oscillospiraceae bacterium]|nr:dockerin type I repeat-containing protein [Oscillospiraceae bacterium]